MPPSSHSKASALAALLVPLALLCGCSSVSEGPARPSMLPFTPDFRLSDEGVQRGVQATQAQCAQVRYAVWAPSAMQGNVCLRYWKAGFAAQGPTPRVLVFFHGDVWTGTATSPDYLKLTDATLQEQAEQWARQIGMPYLFIGRPGTHGSSGEHMQRRRRGESLQISAALDALKARYGIQEWVVAGQSGGGHVTAALLGDRSDIVCAVPASAVSSPKVRWWLRGWTVDSTGHADSYEPLDTLAKAGKHPALRVFVVGSPGDTNTPWTMQLLLADRARAVGLPVEVLSGEGAGPSKHGMSQSARRVAGWCGKGLSTDEIRQRGGAELKG
ncbi:MAG: hypothetical protein J0L58_20625 [Burkholderiales bacterium]|nr:hypothetical protein [Burkholderiales bacterium]